MKIEKYKELNKGALKATFDLQIPQWHMTISCTLMQTERNRWVGLPSREYEKDGKKAYAPLVQFTKEAKNRLDSAVLALIDKGDYEKAPEIKQANHGQANAFSKDMDECPF